MRYWDFSEEDRRLMDSAIEQFNADSYYSLGPDDFEDDEFFFRTREEVESVLGKWLDSPGSYGIMAREMFAYFDGSELDDEDMQLHDLYWGTVARVGDGRYLFCSNSWSDSGLFFQ